MKNIPKTDLDKFPDLETYISNLNKLKTFDFSDLSFKEIQKKYFETAILLPTATTDTSVGDLRKTIFYRVRLLKQIDLKKEDSTVIQTFSFPPSFLCGQNGRANMADTSVFYCSNTGQVAMNESGIEVGSEGFLSAWEIESNRDLRFNILLSNEIPKTNVWKPMLEYLDSKEFQATRLAEEKNYYSYMTELRKFVNDRFMHEEFPYPISSFLANRYLYGNYDMDFIAYPSAKTFHNYVNFAFHPNAVNNHLTLKRVYMFKVTEINDEGINFTVKKVGYLDYSHIKYRSANKSDEKYLGSQGELL